MSPSLADTKRRVHADTLLDAPQESRRASRAGKRKRAQDTISQCARLRPVWCAEKQPVVTDRLNPPSQAALRRQVISRAAPALRACRRYCKRQGGPGLGSPANGRRNPAWTAGIPRAGINFRPRSADGPRPAPRRGTPRRPRRGVRLRTKPRPTLPPPTSRWMEKNIRVFKWGSGVSIALRGPSTA